MELQSTERRGRPAQTQTCRWCGGPILPDGKASAARADGFCSTVCRDAMADQLDLELGLDARRPHAKGMS